MRVFTVLLAVLMLSGCTHSKKEKPVTPATTSEAPPADTIDVPTTAR